LQVENTALRILGSEYQRSGGEMHPDVASLDKATKQ